MNARQGIRSAGRTDVKGMRREAAALIRSIATSTSTVIASVSHANL